MSENPTVVFPEPGQVAVEDRDIPTPRSGDILIRTRRTLISTGTELTILGGAFPRDSAWARYGTFPFLPGYDNIGMVMDAAPDVDRSLIGRRVATYGSHASFVCMPAAHARPVERATLKDEEAAFFTIAEIVMNGVRRGQVRWGETVAVYGAGLLGQLAARVCRFAGARVFVIDPAEWRLSRLPTDVGIIPLNPTKLDVAAEIEGRNRGRKADVVIELTGNPAVIPHEFEVLRPQGRMVVLSSPSGPTPLFDFHDLCNAPSFTIIGAHNASHPPRESLDQPWTQHRDCEMFFDWLADGEIDVARLISHREPFSRAPALYAMLLKDRSTAMGVVLEWPE